MCRLKWNSFKKPINQSQLSISSSSPSYTDMSHRKVHSLGKVPFSWENEPGICKVSHKESPKYMRQGTPKLPPPPCQSYSHRVVGQDVQIPLPSGPSRPLPRSSSTKVVQREDPFLAAYMECTKSEGHGKFSKGKRQGDGKSRLGRSWFRFFSMNSSEIKDNSRVWAWFIFHMLQERGFQKVKWVQKDTWATRYEFMDVVWWVNK